jgi:hypothetical protein
MRIYSLRTLYPFLSPDTMNGVFLTLWPFVGDYVTLNAQASSARRKHRHDVRGSRSHQLLLLRNVCEVERIVG